MQADPFLTSLRAATQHIHKQLEASDISKAIMSPDVSIKNYSDYLQKVHIVHSETETHVFPVLKKVMPDAHQRMKSAAIKKDLQHFSQTAHPESISFIDPQWQSDVAFNMGMLYVSEGSTLGGLYIKKNILSSLGKDVQHAVNFLSVYGEHTGSLWKEFLAQLDAFQAKANPEEKEKIISGAVYGFERTAYVFNYTSH